MSKYYIKGGKCVSKISHADAIKISKKLGINYNDPDILFTPSDFRHGMKIELEHGKCLDNEPSKITNVTNDDLRKTGQITFAHLHEDFRYYSDKDGLREMEKRLEKTRKQAIEKAKKAKLSAQKQKTQKKIKKVSQKKTKKAQKGANQKAKK